MSHLPPRPEYSYSSPPARFESRHRPAPDHAYPSREAYLRSPPRSRYPSDRDRMIPPSDPYARDSYPPPHSRYDRRDDDRYREAHYDRDRRDRDRDRDRDYPSRPTPEYRDRYYDDRRDDPRASSYYSGPSRREEDSRAWTRRGERERSRDKRRDPPYEPRRGIPRRSASPPRTYSSYASRRSEPSSSSARPRSPLSPRRRTPSPRRRTPSPGEYSRSPPPRRSPLSTTRSISPTKPRPLPPSIHASPRYRSKVDDRYDSRRNDQRGPPRRISRSRTRSPVRSTVPRSPKRRVYSRSRSPAYRRERSRSSDRRRIESRGRSPTPPKQLTEAKPQLEKAPLREPPEQPERAVVKQPEVQLKPTVVPGSPAASVVEDSKAVPQIKSEKAPEARVETPVNEKAKAKSEELAPTAPSEPAEDPLWKPEDTKQFDKDGIPLIEKRGILLPDSYWQYVSGKSPITGSEDEELRKQELRKQELIRANPTWQAVQDLTVQYAPMSTSLFLESSPTDQKSDIKSVVDMGEDDEDSKNFDIPSYESWYNQPSNDVEYFLKQVNSKIEPLFQRRAHLESERPKLWRESNQALLDLEIVLLDVKAAEKRRKIAEAQLELAMEGRLGMDYDHSKPSIAERLGETALSALMP